MEETLYDKLGAENLKQMVDTFYDLVQENPIISPLFKTDIETVKYKQTLFLTQFLGGPPLYIKEYGHPRMRMRHMPHKITEEGAIEWLRCMQKAVFSLDIEDDLKKAIFQSFPRLAAHMVNS